VKDTAASWSKCPLFRRIDIGFGRGQPHSTPDIISALSLLRTICGGLFCGENRKTIYVNCGVSAPMPVGKLIWDDENEEHIARHQVTRDEVEEAFYSRSAQMYRSRDQSYRLISQTYGGRYLTVIVARRPGGAWYVVTARDADALERRSHRGR
jgi:uncharacterized DUF497 family protein